MNNILVSGYIGFNNFGDEAIFYALSTHLKSLGCNVSVLCNNKKEIKQKYNVETYNYKKPLEILKAIFNCDILISGGGSLLQNKTSNSSLFYYLFIIFLAKLFFKKTIIFAQGIEPIRGIFQTFLTKIVLKSCNYISLRDENSINLLKSWNIKADLVSDPAYSLVQDIKITKDKKDILVQLRDFKGLNPDFITFLAENLAKREENISVISFQDEIDEKICLDFIKKLKKFGKNSNFIYAKSIDETIEIINNAKYMLSTRLHGLIISNALKTKTFAFIYDDKVKTLSKELNLINIDLFNFKKEELNQKINEFFNNHINEPHQSFRRFYWECLDSELLK